MIQQYWHNLSPQEQRTVKWGGIALAILLFIKLIWWPLSSRVDRLKTDIQNEQALIEWMTPAVAALKNATTSKPVNQNAPRLSTIEKSFTQSGLSPFVKNLSQNASDQIILQASDIPFGALITCLEMLDKQYGIVPLSFTASKQKTGVVTAEIVF
jgi:type II secretory pathway component PulM